MSRKTLVMIGVVVGSTVGGFVPALWGASMFSMSGVVLTAVGGIAGIYAGYRLSGAL